MYFRKLVIASYFSFLLRSKSFKKLLANVATQEYLPPGPENQPFQKEPPRKIELLSCTFWGGSKHSLITEECLQPYCSQHIPLINLKPHLPQDVPTSSPHQRKALPPSVLVDLNWHFSVGLSPLLPVTNILWSVFLSSWGNVHFFFLLMLFLFSCGSFVQIYLAGISRDTLGHTNMLVSRKCFHNPMLSWGFVNKPSNSIKKLPLPFRKLTYSILRSDYY